MKILVRGTNWIGDAVMTIPAIRKLRSIFPDAEMTLLTRGWAEGIFRASELFDRIITTDSTFDQVRELRRERFDLAVIFPNSFHSALVAKLGGLRRSFGYASDKRSMLLTDAIEMPQWKDSRHEVYYYLNLVEAIEARLVGKVSETVEHEPRVVMPAESKERAQRMLQTHGVDLERKLVILAPGSTNSRAKRWLPEKFALLNDRLQSEVGSTVVLLGSPGDKPVSQSVVDLAVSKPIDLTGATDITLAAAILSLADLLVSNDMGLAHLAPAVGTRTLVIFGPTNQLTTRPLSSFASVISANVECSPCMLRDCPIDHRCMTRVTTERVFENARDSLLS
jgi:heptosyltransferase II